MTHTSEMHKKLSSEIFQPRAIDFILSEGQGQHWPLITMCPHKTLCSMVSGEVQQSGFIFRMPPRPLLSSPQHSLLLFLPPFDGLGALKFVNTHILKASLWVA